MTASRTPRQPAPFRPSRQTVLLLALFVGYLVAVYLIDRTGGSKVLVSVVTAVFFAVLMIVRPLQHWLDWGGHGEAAAREVGRRRRLRLGAAREHSGSPGVVVWPRVYRQ